jgi:hypothetical protein
MKNSNLTPVKGDKRKQFGKWFVFTGTCWELAEIQRNVITQKHVGNKGLLINRNAKTNAFIAHQL